MSAKKQKVSRAAEATAAAVAKLLDDVPNEELSDTLVAVEATLSTAKARLKTLGKDPAFERLMFAANSWVVEGAEGRPLSKLNTDSVRQLLTHLKLKKAKASFDEESSDMSGNKQGADFEIQFVVGQAQGYLVGSAANTEGAEYEGQIETSFLPGMLEDDLLEHVIWEPRLRDCRVKDDIVQWMMAADVPEKDLDWRDAGRAVAAAVFSLAKASKYNDEPWAFEFLEKRVREELLRCPDRSF